MAKTLMQQNVELAEKNAELQKRVTDLEAQLTEFSTKLGERESALATMTVEKELATSRVAQLERDLAEITAARDAANAKVQELERTLALNPGINQPAGQTPPKDGAPPKDLNTMTWADALKACGGDYVRARMQYPDVHRAFIEAAKKERGK